MHTQGWGVIAEAMQGNGNQAYEYFRNYMPAAYNTKAEIRQIEPYVYCQSTHSKYNSRYGNSRVPWLSGSATWSFVAATQYILGLQPQVDGFRINPCIPAHWNEFEVTRIFRGKLLKIKVLNPSNVQFGVKKLIVNGIIIPGNTIRFNLLGDENEILVTLG